MCWKEQAWRRDRFLLLNVSTCDEKVSKASELRCIPSSLPCRIRSRLVPSSLVMVSVDCVSSAGGGVLMHYLGNEIIQIKYLSFSLHSLSAYEILFSRCASHVLGLRTVCGQGCTLSKSRRPQSRLMQLWHRNVFVITRVQNERMQGEGPLQGYRSLCDCIGPRKAEILCGVYCAHLCVVGPCHHGMARP